MRPCIKCYRLIENDAENCSYCGQSQRYEAPEETYQGTKCPRCGAYLYFPEKGCKGCGYKKKTGIPKVFLIAAVIFMLLIFILLLKK